MLKNKALIAPLGLVGITILSGVFLMPSNSSATDTIDAVDSVSIGVPISCSMEGTGMTSHNASIPNGTYTADIGTTTLKAYCNDDEGFAIFAAGYTGDEIGGTNSTKLVGTNNSIITGTATSGDTSNWAMKLATDSGATYAITLDNSFGSYSAVPASYTKVAHRDSGTDIGTGATGASLTTTYVAFISKTESADIYNGKVKYTLVHPSSETPLQPVACEAGKICYNANANTVEGQMGKQAPTSSELTDGITLWAPNFKRDGYGFAGWNDAFDYSGDFYGPNETITAPSDIQTNGLSLYAVWIKSQGILQNWDGCSNLAQDSVTALTDNRDNNTYAVAKLADGKCWMIENLRLDDPAELSVTNTHNPALPITNDYSNSITSNHLSPTSTTWCTSPSPSCLNQSNLTTDNTVLYVSNTETSYSKGVNVFSYGNYYNWYSATAGHGKYGNNYGSGYDAPGDICPAHWHLPSGRNNDSGEFYTLNTAINGEVTNINAKIRSYPVNFVYSGNKTGSYTGGGGSSARYMSTSASDLATAVFLQLNGTSLNHGFTQSKYEGGVVRCIYQGANES